MPRLPRLTAQEAEKLLLAASFTLIRSKGSHRIYAREGDRVVVPFHGSKILHPKIIQQVMGALSFGEDESQEDV